MISHYYVSAVIVTCLIDFPTAFDSILKSLLRYIFPKIAMTLRDPFHMRPKQLHALHLERKRKLLIFRKNLLLAKLPEVAMATGIVSKPKFVSLIIRL